MSKESFFSQSANRKLPLSVIILITVICWAVTIGFNWDNIPVQINNSLFYSLLQAFLPISISLGINLFLVLATSILLLWLNQTYSIIRTKTYLPFLFYMLFITTDHHSFFSFSGNISTIILVITVFHLFKSYQKEKTVEEAFNVGALISLGSLFSTQMLFFIPIIWIGLSFVQSFSLKSFFASLVGVLAVYWLVFCWYVYKKDLAGFTEPFQYLFQINISSITSLELPDWIRVGFSLLITILAIINFQLHSFKDKIRTRVYFYFILTLIGFVAILLSLGILPMTEYAGTYYFSVSLLAAHFFATTNTRLSSIFFYLTLITFIGLLFF